MSEVSLTQLGQPVAGFANPDEAVLERVPNPQQGQLYLARFTAPEFTSLCPVTGQPDFAHFVIDYAPRDWLLESKSLKLFLASFRNIGAFHEDATITIGKRIVELFKQNQYNPIPVEVQAAILWAMQNNFLDDVTVEKVKDFQAKLTDFLSSRKSELLDKIRIEKTINDALAAELKAAVGEFKQTYR